MSTLKLTKKLPEWRKNFKPGEKVDPAKVERLMRAHRPDLFNDDRRPLPIGIHRALLDDPKLPVTRKQLRLFLHRWALDSRYKSQRDKGVERIDETG